MVLAVLGLDADAAAVLEHEAGDAPAAEDRPAALLDQPRERERERGRAPARERPAVLLAPVGE